MVKAVKCELNLLNKNIGEFLETDDTSISNGIMVEAITKFQIYYGEKYGVEYIPSEKEEYKQLIKSRI